MAFQEKLLAQVRENSTNVKDVYSPDPGVTAIFSTIKLCNTTNASVKFSLFCDDDGDVADESTALYFDNTLTANETLAINDFAAMNNPDGNLRYSTDTANAVTITVFGAEISNS